jgi:peptidoglycan/xylan/chitin deacetylase (PgdA/CDA1 family)
MTIALPAGARAAISVTYDDALAVHREEVAPLLTERGLRGTFYCPAAAPDLHHHVEAWRGIAALGHELGNHTCWHPCRNADGKADWVGPYDLSRYEKKRILDEIRLANAVLRLIDGKTERTFAASCGQLTVGRGEHEEDFSADLRKDVLRIRSGRTQAPIPFEEAEFVVPHVGGDRRTADELIAIVEQARSGGGWLIVIIHGVGEGTHGHFIDPGEHRKFLDHLAKHRDDLWVAPTVDVARHLS